MTRSAVARIAGLTLATTNGLLSGALAMVLEGATGEVALYSLTLHWPELEDGGKGRNEWVLSQASYSI